MDDLEQGGESIFRVLAMLRYRAALIARFVALSLCLAVVLLLVIPPKYTATTSILLDPVPTNGMRIGGGEFTSSPVDSAKIASVTAVIKSSDFLDQVVKNERLTDDPEFVGSPESAFLRQLRRLIGIQPQDRSESAKLAKAEEALRKATTVMRDGLTYVIKIDVASADAQKAKALATTIGELYVKNRAEASIISPPRLPRSPSFPRAKLFLLIALGAGAAGGIAIAFLLERSANWFTTPDQVERSLQLPVLASAPMLTDNELGRGAQRIGIFKYAAQHPISQFAESLRAIRFGLLQDRDRACRIVQFASPMPNEGKTTLASCVAASLAMDGMRTVFIDCDLRLSHPSAVFGVKNGRGVGDYLMGLASFEDVLTPSFEHFLRVIPAGRIPRSPPDLANSPRLTSLIEAASAVADFVIIDSPAMEVAVDAAIISQIADATVIVARWRASDRALVARAIENIRRARGRVVGVVLNAVDMKKATCYGYWSKDYLRKTRDYYATAQGKGRAIPPAGQPARDTI
jgi:capsular exopolysaccharide synthesis family protein